MPPRGFLMSALPTPNPSQPVRGPHRYLTYKLDLLKTLATKAIDPHYQVLAGMRVRELRVLRLLHDQPGIAATELRHQLVLDKTLLSKNLAELERRGLIERRPHERDNRLQCLHLSAEGQRVWRACEQLGREIEADMFADLSPEEWEQLHTLLNRAIDSFNRWQAAGGLPPAEQPDAEPA